MLACLDLVRGKLYLSIRNVCLDCQPVAVITRGMTPLMCKISGVLAPTHEASSQCIGGKLAHGPVPLGAPSRPDFHWQSRSRESSEQGPTGSIDGCGIASGEVSPGLGPLDAQTLQRSVCLS